MDMAEIQKEYGEVLSEHGQWIVTESCIVAPDENYYIQRETAATTLHGTHLSEWALHVGEKVWCRPADLVAALKASIALSNFDDPIDWQATEDRLRYRAYVVCCMEEAKRRLGTEAGGLMRPSQVFAEYALGKKLAAQFWQPGLDWSSEQQDEA